MSETGKPVELPLVNDLPGAGTTPAGKIEGNKVEGEKPIEGAKPEGEKPAEKPSEGEKPKDILDDEEAKPGEEKPAAAKLDLKIPDGVKVDEAGLAAFREKATAAGLEPGVAQELLDMHLAAVDETRKGLSADFETIQTHWMSEIKADKDVGGDRLGESKAAVAKLLKEHGSPEAREALKLTGASNNPAVFKFLVNLGKALSEGKAVPGGKPMNPGSGSLASAMYPNLPEG